MRKKQIWGKRVCSVLCATVLVTGVLSGCGNKETTEATNYVSEEEAQTQASELETEESEIIEEATESETESSEVTEANESGAEESLVDGESVQDAAKSTYNGYGEEETEEIVNDESYNNIVENSFQSVDEMPLSTFSADVDTASYSNVRRMITDGYNMDQIPKDAVRIEELINYFDYDFAAPRGNKPFAVTMEVSNCPWNSDNYVMMVGMKTKEISAEEMLPSNFVFLLDVSGSMSDENKLPLLQESFKLLTENLSGNDRVTIVTYASNDTVVLEGEKGNHKEEILDAIYSLSADGSTNGSDGIETAYELAEEYFMEGGNNRVILATDGDLNVGVTSEDELEDLITEKRESGIFLSVLGFGTDNLKDDKMEVLADCGNGNYAYIDSVSEAEKVLVKELGATMQTVAKDVKLQVEFNPTVISEYRLIGYENRELSASDFKDDTKDAGELGAGHTIVALYEVVPTQKGSAIKLKYQDKYFKDNKDVFDEDEEYCTVSIRYKEPNQSESIKKEFPMDGTVLTENPSDDFVFATTVAEFGMLLRDSEYEGDASMDDVLGRLEDLDSEDADKVEFKELVEEMLYK